MATALPGDGIAAGYGQTPIHARGWPVLPLTLWPERGIKIGPAYRESRSAVVGLLAMAVGCRCAVERLGEPGMDAAGGAVGT